MLGLTKSKFEVCHNLVNQIQITCMKILVFLYRVQSKLLKIKLCFTLSNVHVWTKRKDCEEGLRETTTLNKMLSKHK